MSIPEAVIEAASIRRVEKHGFDEARASRVILALAENLPESAVEKALDAWYPGEDWRRIFAGTAAELNVRREMRAAIIAALKEVGGEKDGE